MAEFFSKYGVEIILALVTSGALGFCKYLHSQLKNYKALLNEKNDERLDETIQSKIEPVLQELEELRKYTRENRQIEQHHVDLLVSSYRFRLIQLCRLYLKQGYVTQEQYDQLTEFFKLYTGLGGNGQAKEYYDKAIALDIRDE